jgi:hypothetical protein
LANTLDLGDDQKPGHWKCPIKNGHEVGGCSFMDGQAKVIEEKLAPIIEKALALQESCKDDWIEVVRKMTWILTPIRQREDFSDEKIIITGVHLEEWTVDWILHGGKEGMINYTHFMISGRIVYYMKYLSIFCRYSNQGWEYSNSKYRYVYCHITHNGGSSGTHDEAGSKMKPIGLWCVLFVLDYKGCRRSLA